MQAAGHKDVGIGGLLDVVHGRVRLHVLVELWFLHWHIRGSRLVHSASWWLTPTCERHNCSIDFGGWEGHRLLLMNIHDNGRQPCTAARLYGRKSQ